MHKAIGSHYLWDIYDVNAALISYEHLVKEQMEYLHSLTGLTQLGQQYKQFDPIGVTGILLLSESHMSIHTWPEHNYAAIDIFSCRPLEIEKITEGIHLKYNTQNVTFRKLERGLVPQPMPTKDLVE